MKTYIVYDQETPAEVEAIIAAQAPLRYHGSEDRITDIVDGVEAREKRLIFTDTPEPPPVASVEERMAALEADNATLKADSASHKGRLTALEAGGGV